jgi:proline dehydrogenase
MSLRTVLLALSRRPGLGIVIDRMPVTRALVRRFVAGPSAGDALRVIGGLEARGLTTAVTCLGENVVTPADADQATRAYLDLVEEIRRRKLRCEPSVKLTHLGLDLDPGLCEGNVTKLLDTAATSQTRIWIDMESSEYTDRTLDLYARLRARHRNVATVVQAYLRRTADDVERLIAIGATLRLCKGAYQESPRIAYTTRAEVDASYARLATRLLADDARKAGVYPGFATHDDRLQRHVVTTARTVGATGWEIQMLSGIRHELHDGLLADGVPLRVLVSYGEAWYGFFMRRLAERPANLRFVLPFGRRRSDGNL